MVHLHIAIALLSLALFSLRGVAKIKSINFIQNRQKLFKLVNMVLAILLLTTGLWNAYWLGYLGSVWAYLKLGLFVILIYGSIFIFKKNLSEINFRLIFILLLGLWFVAFYIASTKVFG